MKTSFKKEILWKDFGTASKILISNDANRYYDVEKEANLAILEILEREGIDSLHIELETDPIRNEQWRQAANN